MSDSLKISTNSGNAGAFQQKNREGMVDIQDEKNVSKWAEVLGLDSVDLLRAVKEFGPKIKDIRLGLAARNKDLKEAA